MSRITNTDFNRISGKMKEAGLFRTDSELARILQVHRNSIRNYRIGAQPFDGVKANMLAAWESAYETKDSRALSLIESKILNLNLQAGACTHGAAL